MSKNKEYSYLITKGELKRMLKILEHTGHGVIFTKVSKIPGANQMTDSPSFTELCKLNGVDWQELRVA